MSEHDLEIIRATFERHLAIAKVVQEQLAPAIAEAAVTLIDCLDRGNKILLCGNGGSAADAQHFAAELTGRFIRRRSGLAAVALTTDTSALTAIGNDFGFDQIFARQVDALATEGDVLVTISTSGNSANVLTAMATARAKGCRTLALAGRDGGKVRDRADLAIVIPADETPVIQEMHICVIHLLCELIDRHFASPTGS